MWFCGTLDPQVHENDQLFSGIHLLYGRCNARVCVCGVQCMQRVACAVCMVCVVYVCAWHLCTWICGACLSVVFVFRVQMCTLHNGLKKFKHTVQSELKNIIKCETFCKIAWCSKPKVLKNCLQRLVSESSELCTYHFLQEVPLPLAARSLLNTYKRHNSIRELKHSTSK